MDLFSPKKGKPKPKPKAKVVPMPNDDVAAAAPAAAAPRVIPRVERYNIGFGTNRPMSNANKAALAARRRAMTRPAARNYGYMGPAVGGVGGAGGGAGGADGSMARPALLFPNNNAIQVPFPERVRHPAAAAVPNYRRPALAEYGRLYAPTPTPKTVAKTPKLPENMGTGVPAAAEGNEFVNVNLIGGTRRRRKTHRRRATHHRRT
jgi:hypothetical protein